MRKPGGTALTWWFIAFAGYAAILSIVTRGPGSAWGAWAAVGYGCAAVVSWRSRGVALPLLIGVCGAVAVPTIRLAASWQPGGEPAVLARAAYLLLHNGSPYLPPGELLSAQSYNPYLPAMSVFGLPRLAGLTGAAGNPASWMAVTSLGLVAIAMCVGLPGQRWRAQGVVTLLRDNIPGIVRKTALALVTPVLALPLALGTTDPPVIALICLALACAGRPVASRPAAAAPVGTGTPRQDAAPRWNTWSVLSAIAIGAACAMKAIAWPAFPVIAAMTAAREGRRAAIRFAVTAAATGVILTAVFAPALLAQPRAFADNIIAYPLGLARHLTPAASPLPGHLLASTGTAGRVAALVLLLAVVAGVALSLVLRPPRDARAATVRLAVALTLLFALAPDARFGYFAYPAALLGWLALTGAWAHPLRAWSSFRRRAVPGWLHLHSDDVAAGCAAADQCRQDERGGELSPH